MLGRFGRLVVLSLGFVFSLAMTNASAETWSAVAPMAEPRANQTATLLPNGDVLVAGGYNGFVEHVGGRTEPLALAQLFDPSSRSWMQVAPMRVARDGAQAALLRDGRVLVVGGYEPYICCESASTAEVYDPSSNTWSPVPAPAELRGVESLTALPNGGVLLIGLFGPHLYSFGAKVGAAIYNPSTGAWSTAAVPLVERERGATATLMSNGRLLLVGGYKGEQLPGLPVQDKYTVFASAEEYDPTANTWTTLAPMQQPRTEQAAALLPDGSVLVAGGEGEMLSPGPLTISDALHNTETYDPATNAWHTTQPMNIARYMQTATTLTDGDVLVTGGGECSTLLIVQACLGYGHPPVSGDCCAASSAELYEPSADRWTPTEPVTSGIWHTATLLQSGEVLVTGGELPLASHELSSAYIYGPAPPPSQPLSAAPLVSVPVPPPALTGLSQSHRVWREKRAARSARARRAIPVGTAFAFILNQPANVKLTFSQWSRGYRAGGKCLAHRSRDKQHTCTRARLRGTLVTAAGTGKNKLAFRGALPHGNKLPTGNYSVSVTASTTTASSPAKILNFTIAG
jgi:N-acetylneuraminic acid mutarotase